MKSSLKSSLGILGICFGATALAQAPSLPQGLGESTEPSLPAGLIGLESPEEPQKSDLEPVQEFSPKSNIRFNATLESVYGSLLQSNPVSDDDSLSEVRLQTRWTGSTKSLQYRLSTDWVKRPPLLNRTAFFTHRQIRYKRSTGSCSSLYRSLTLLKWPLSLLPCSSQSSRYRSEVRSGCSTIERSSSTIGSRLSATTKRCARWLWAAYTVIAADPQKGS